MLIHRVLQPVRDPRGHAPGRCMMACVELEVRREAIRCEHVQLGMDDLHRTERQYTEQGECVPLRRCGSRRACPTDPS